jgi:hypothetical protein
MDKIQPITGTKIKFFKALHFEEVEELVNKWIEENGSRYQYIYDIQYNHNMALEEQDDIYEHTLYGHNVSVMIVYGIK